MEYKGRAQRDLICDRRDGYCVPKIKRSILTERGEWLCELITVAIVAAVLGFILGNIPWVRAWFMEALLWLG